MSNDTMVQKAMKSTIINAFEIAEENMDEYWHDFYVLYRSTMMDAINTKRGTCAQLGGKIVLGTYVTVTPHA